MKHPMNKPLADAYTKVLRERNIMIKSSVVPTTFRLLHDPNDKFVQDVLSEYKWATKK
jgi:hypothetical protein